MILVFGGTTEGKSVIATLTQTGHPFWYSSKIPIDVVLPPNGQYRSGAFTTESLTAFCREQHIQLIIHASHPFAEILHETIRIVSERTGIPVVRLERTYHEPVLHPLIRYVSSYEAVLHAWLQEGTTPVLSLTGVQTILRWQPYWQQRKMYCRILPRDTSLAVAKEAGFPESQLILSFPGTTVAAEQQLFQELNVQGIVTKESGESGFLPVKTAAAIAAGIPLYIIRRPALPAHFIKVNDSGELIKLLPA